MSTPLPWRTPLLALAAMLLAAAAAAQPQPAPVAPAPPAGAQPPALGAGPGAPPGGWQQGAPPPGGWQQGAPPQPGPEAGAGWGPEEPPRDKPSDRPGVTEKGLPLGMRGGLKLELSRLSAGDADLAFGTIDVVAQIPIRPRTFLDARLPLVVGSLGNPMLGVHHVARLGQSAWLSAGGAFGFPLVHRREDLLAKGVVQQAYWNAHEFSPETVPIMPQLGFEAHAGATLFRLEADPILYISTSGRGDPMELAFQHAAEIQLGHEIGGGLRLQGVLFATSDASDIFYQSAMEPFFLIEHQLLFLRFGLLLPLDEQLGPPFDETWGVRAATGLRLD